jgi:hypothetical protein
MALVEKPQFLVDCQRKEEAIINACPDEVRRNELPFIITIDSGGVFHLLFTGENLLDENVVKTRR